ncbi:DUF6980 family protein [Photobacterium sp. J15]|uniref:DUF6980 family protein n=1 Tax=Photobacterium sp. J15 TaxID=265901 RepID=UPI004040A903
MFDARQALKEKVINYSLKFREYSISVPDGGSSYITIKHCPWCAFRVPSSLRDMWFDILDEMGCVLKIRREYELSKVLYFGF